MKKKRCVYTFLQEFKLAHNVSQTAAAINRAWGGEGSTCDRIVQRWFLKFRSGDMRLEDQCGRRCPSTTDNQHINTLVEQCPLDNPQENWQGKKFDK